MPSEQVICARCGGGTFALGGTSSACPAAAGLTAQFLHARPTYAGNRAGVVSLYQSTGVQVIGDTSKRRVNLTAAIAGTGGGTPPPSQLANGTTYNYSVALGAITQYQIVIPANATNLTVTITGSGDADLYVKRTSISWPGEQGMHNAAEFKAPYIGGSAESVNFPAPAAATWNVLLHGYAAASGTIRATWSVGGGGATWHPISWLRETPHNYSNNTTYTPTSTYPGATQVGLHFNRIDTENNYDFLRIKNGAGTVLYTVSNNPITNGVGSAFGRTDGWVYITGNTITVELTTDYSVIDWGYKVDQASALYCARAGARAPDSIRSLLGATVTRPAAIARRASCIVALARCARFAASRSSQSPNRPLAVPILIHHSLRKSTHKASRERSRAGSLAIDGSV
jgi:hypothetical protein